jgi:hypothetical protein
VFAFGEGIHGALGMGSRKSMVASTKLSVLPWSGHIKRVFAGWYVNAETSLRCRNLTHYTIQGSHSIHGQR